MTREEEICKKARIYDLECTTNSIVEAFIEGAEWADKRPKNPWHKTDDGDFPKEGVDYQMKDEVFLCGKPMLLHICEDCDDSGEDYKGYFDGKFWRYWDKPISCDVVRGKVTHWMSIPELK